MAKKKNKKHNIIGGSEYKPEKRKISDAIRKRYLSGLETDKYNRGSSEYRTLLKKMIEERYNNNIHSLKDFGGKNMIEKMKVDGPYRKRRLTAIQEFISEISLEFAEKYPDINIGNLSAQNHIYASFCADFFSIILMVFSISQ